MSRHRAAAIASSLIAVVTIFALSPEAQGPPPGAPTAPIVQLRVRDRLARDGRARVIVELKLPSGQHVPEGRLGSRAAVLQQRQAIAGVRGRLLAKLTRADHSLVRQFQSVPYVALEVSPAALAALEAAPDDVVRVMEDAIVRPTLADSVPLIQGDQVWAAGYDGSGTVVAILDSGVDGSHPFLAGKVVEEACYSTTDPGIAQTLCPNGQDEQLGSGSAVPCSLDSCLHGTHVAGIATGNGDNAGQTFSGVAKNAKIMAVQVFSEVVDSTTCGGAAPCMGGYTSDIIAGLERVYVVASSAQQNIVAVNMSLGGGSFTAPCDTEPYKPAIDNLRSIGVASVIASGNDYSGVSMGSPACISSAVSVGSTTKTDTVSFFSNVTPFLSLFAPGESINSSVPGGGYAVDSGTSMAAPHVTGTWALIREAVPGGSVDAILNALRTTGLPITDNRILLAPGTTTVPRVRAFQALASLTSVNNPVPSIVTVTPTRLRAGMSATLTVTGTGFNGLSQLKWNGVSKATTVSNTTKLTA